MNKFLKYGVALSISIALSGCLKSPSPEHSNGHQALGGPVTIENLAFDVQKDGYKEKQNRMVFISGFSPIPDVGYTYLHLPDRTIYSMIGVTPQYSHFLEMKSTKNVNESKFVDVKEKLIDLHTSVAKIVRTGYLYHSAKDDSNATKLKTELETQQEIFDNNYTAFMKAMKEDGVYLYHWDKSHNGEDNNNGSLSSLFSLDSSHEKQFNGRSKGYVLVSGLSVSALVIGNDINKFLSHFNTNYSENNEFFIRMVSYALKAEKIYYLDDYYFDFAERLNLDFDLLKENEAVRVKVFALLNNYRKRINQLTQIGNSSDIKISYKPVFWNESYENNISKYLTDMNNTSTVFYAVDTDIREFKKVFPDRNVSKSIP